MDGRPLAELFDPAIVPPPVSPEASGLPLVAEPVTAAAYTEEEDAEIQQRLADLGYL